MPALILSATDTTLDNEARSAFTPDELDNLASWLGSFGVYDSPKKRVVAMLRAKAAGIRAGAPAIVAGACQDQPSSDLPSAPATPPKD